MQHSCGSPSRQRSCVGARPPHHLRRLFSKVEFNLAAIPPHLCREESRQKCSGQQGGSRTGCWRRQCQSSFQGIKTFGLAAPPRCQPQTAPVPPHQRYWRRTSIRRTVPVREGRCTPHPRRYRAHKVGRSGPGHGGRLPTHRLSVFVGGREPKVSRPWSRQSPPSSHTFQTASVATLHFVPRPMALADSQTPHKATAATKASVRLPAP